jgi:hypothetical protein
MVGVSNDFLNNHTTLYGRGVQPEELRVPHLTAA